MAFFMVITQYLHFLLSDSVVIIIKMCIWCLFYIAFSILLDFMCLLVRCNLICFCINLFFYYWCRLYFSIIWTFQLHYASISSFCFLVSTAQFVVMFTGGDISGKSKCSCNAYISQSTQGLRSLLREHVSCTHVLFVAHLWYIL